MLLMTQAVAHGAFQKKVLVDPSANDVKVFELFILISIGYRVDSPVFETKLVDKACNELGEDEGRVSTKIVPSFELFKLFVSFDIGIEAGVSIIGTTVVGLEKYELHVFEKYVLHAKNAPDITINNKIIRIHISFLVDFPLDVVKDDVPDKPLYAWFISSIVQLFASNLFLIFSVGTPFCVSCLI